MRSNRSESHGTLCICPAPAGQRPGADLTLTSPGEAEKARRFHSGLPGYAPTPLVSLDGLAHSLGVSKIWIKDESKRFGLNAFKALGGSYAMARCLSEKLGKPLEEMSFEELCAPAARRALGDITFVTATDGNHGRGWPGRPGCWARRRWSTCPRGARRSGWRTSAPRGAQAEITEYNYDDAVRLANRMAEEHGWILIQDTAWPGYEEIPAHIMQGLYHFGRRDPPAAGGAGGGEAHPSVSPGGGGQLRRCGAGLLYLPYGGRSGRSPPSWSQTGPTACSAPPRPTTGRCTSSLGTWTA